MNIMKKCQVCKKHYDTKNRKYKLSSDTPAINEICDECFDKIICSIICSESAYCIQPNLELQSMDLTDKQKMFLHSIESESIKMRAKYND